MMIEVLPSPEGNIAPKNGCLQDEFPSNMVPFQGLC